MTDSLYLGRFQQGSEIALVLQCTDAVGAPEDPAYVPWVQIWRDELGDEPVTLLSSHRMPADLRGVEPGLFRLPHFLGSAYSPSGRYIAVFKWIDSSGIAMSKAAAFHVFSGGSADGNVIAMAYSSRPDAAYIVLQCDSGRLIRKPNPR